MGAHQPEESASSYSYIKVKDSEATAANTSAPKSQAPALLQGHANSQGVRARLPAVAVTNSESDMLHGHQNGRTENGSSSNNASGLYLRVRNSEHVSRTAAGRLLQRNYAHGGRRLATVAAGPLNPLLDPRIYNNNSRPANATAAYHEEQMRRSMHRLVSATSRFDRVTNGALSFLSDIARLYMMRIGEACRARADLANRTDPNFLDVLETTSIDLGVNWESVSAWVEEWKDEVGSIVSPPAREDNDDGAENNHTVADNARHSLDNGTDQADQQHSLANGTEQTAEKHTRRNSWDGIQQASRSATTFAVASAMSRSMSAGEFAPVYGGRQVRGDLDGYWNKKFDTDKDVRGSGDNNDGGDNDDGGGIDDILGDLKLGCLLLDEADMAEGTQAIIMPHLPPLVSLTEQDDEGDQSDVEMDTGTASTVAEAVAALGDSVNVPSTAAAAKDAASAGSARGDDALDTDTDTEETPETVLARILQITTASLSALHPSIAGDKPLYAFFRPASKFDPACAPDDMLPDFDIPDAAFVSAPARVEEKLSKIDRLELGKPMFLCDDTAERDVVGDSEKVWRQAKHAIYQGIYDDAAEQAMDEMENAPTLIRRVYPEEEEETDDVVEAVGLRAEVGGEGSSAKKTDAADKVGQSGLSDSGALVRIDNDIEEDVLDIDMGMDVDVDLDFDLDVVSGNLNTPSLKQVGGSSNFFNMADGSRPAGTGGGGGTHEDALADLSQKTVIVPEDVVIEEPIMLPISSGLRGSGKQHWSSEWFTPAMSKRLTTMVAADVVPCDSLFLNNPLANQRLVVDEVARAFVDSEGGGHLHATTPLEGFGPSANTYTVPNSSGSALRWTLHYIMQTKGTTTVDSLYTGRSSLAGGVSGDGVSQYIGRMCSLIKTSIDEETELVVNGALGLGKDKGSTNASAKPDQGELIEQLVAGTDKRIPWAQNRLDIHVVESRIVGRAPQKIDPKQPPPPTPAPVASSSRASSPPPPPASASASSAQDKPRLTLVSSLSPAPEPKHSPANIGGEVVEHNASPIDRKQRQRQADE
ncbi:hypothetical protein LPJ66_005303 [Kickxella alabastrina]|uniref:Uncharacterized protein n=1 Tax=Kickxella alabastrina TaxID=61397 RepID=A0ACC1IH91_9FUNG|nr:hypothetical protein LPJ66_005303 [Kickxella alabastrina]